MNRASQYMYSQFRHPRGPLGRLAGAVMARRPSNVERNRWAVELVDPAPDARILEIGYGPGVTLGRWVAAAPMGEVLGVDVSATMRSVARRRNRRAVRSGQLRLLVAGAEDLPAGIGLVDVVFACNVAMFWSDPVATMRGLIDVLAPDGRVVLVQQPRGSDQTERATERARVELTDLMRSAGLADVVSYTHDLQPPAVCVVGRR